MPLFGNNILQRRIPQRKFSTRQTGRDVPEDESFSGSTVTLNLGHLKPTFDGGRWSSQCEPSSDAKAEGVILKRAIGRLEEENNLLKLKYEVLLDMLAQETFSKGQ